MEHNYRNTVTTSQSNGLNAQKRQGLSNLGYGLNNVRHTHESLHGNKFIRNQNTRSYEISYIPRNLIPLVKK